MCLTQFCTSLITYCVILSVFGHFEKRSLNISFLFKWSCRMNGWTHCCLVLIANFVFKDAAPTLRFTGRIFELTSALGWAVGRRITRHTHSRTLVALCSCEKIFVKRLEFCSWCCALSYSFAWKHSCWRQSLQGGYKPLDFGQLRISDLRLLCGTQPYRHLWLFTSCRSHSFILCKANRGLINTRTHQVAHCLDTNPGPPYVEVVIHEL